MGTPPDCVPGKRRPGRGGRRPPWIAWLGLFLSLADGFYWKDPQAAASHIYFYSLTQPTLLLSEKYRPDHTGVGFSLDRFPVPEIGLLLEGAVQQIGPSRQDTARHAPRKEDEDNILLGLDCNLARLQFANDIAWLYPYAGFGIVWIGDQNLGGLADKHHGLLPSANLGFKLILVSTDPTFGWIPGASLSFKLGYRHTPFAAMANGMGGGIASLLVGIGFAGRRDPHPY